MWAFSTARICTIPPACKNMRHVKIKSGHEPDSVALGHLLHASYLDVKMRLRAE